MLLQRLWLQDFRSYETLDISFESGLTALLGKNGFGKTNILEALAYVSNLKSFRRSPTESLIRHGCDAAFIRAVGIREDREVLVELEIRKGRSKVQVNRQKLKRSRDILGALRVTVFTPDDLALLKEGPSIRRDYIDDIAVSLEPTFDLVLSKFGKILKQRNALLKQCRGRLDSSAAVTLDVWDEKLCTIGSQVVEKRRQVLAAILPVLSDRYQELSVDSAAISATYVCSWEGEFAAAINASRNNDVRRGVTTCGPHRDDIDLQINGFATRTQCSQGEQRTMALALRLAGHLLVTDRLGEPPMLLLDDVLSELDEDRAASLLQTLPEGQTVISSATALPPLVKADRELTFSDKGVLVEKT